MYVRSLNTLTHYPIAIGNIYTVTTYVESSLALKLGPKCINPIWKCIYLLHYEKIDTHASNFLESFTKRE